MNVAQARRILNTNSNDPDEIKKVFRKLSKQHHPDAGGDEEKFKQINEAKSVLDAHLKDPVNRAFQDVFGKSVDNFWKNFSDFYTNAQQKNEVKVVYMDLTLTEAYWGCEKTIAQSDKKIIIPPKTFTNNKFDSVDRYGNPIIVSISNITKHNLDEGRVKIMSHGSMHISVEVFFAKVILGGEFVFEFLGKKIKTNLDPFCKTKNISGAGFNYGDIILNISIEKTKLTEKHKKAIQQILEEESEYLI